MPKGFFPKVANILFSLLLLSWMVTASHEQFHQWGAIASGVPDGGGYVKFQWGLAHFYYPDGYIPTQFQDLVVSLAGGMGVAIAYLIGLVVRRLSLKYTPWDLDDIFALQLVGLWQGLYAFSEIINWQYWGGLISGVAGLAIAILIYGRRTLDWISSDG